MARNVLRNMHETLSPILKNEFCGHDINYIRVIRYCFDIVLRSLKY